MSGKNTIVGSTGEYYTAAKLSEKGWTVTLTLKNNPGIDILVSDGVSNKAIQVKTTARPKADWVCPLPKITKPSLVYIFVVLKPKDSAAPDFYIVPSKDAYKIIKRIDEEYAANRPNRKPAKGVSKIWFKTEREAKPYKNNWDKLGLKEPDKKLPLLAPKKK